MGNPIVEMMNMQEDSRNEKLARILGVSYDELEQTKWKLDEEKSEEGLVHHLLIVFEKNSPRNILDKIKGLDENDTVWLDPNELANKVEFDDEFGGEG